MSTQDLWDDLDLEEDSVVFQTVTGARDAAAVLDQALATGDKIYRLSRKQIKLIRELLRSNATLAAGFYEMSLGFGDLLKHEVDDDD